MPPDGDVASHQIEKPCASRVAKTPVYRADLLSIEALARHRQACVVAHGDIHLLRFADKQDPVACARFDGAMSLVDERSFSIRDLVSTLPARTLADVVVQVALIQEIVDQHRDLDATNDQLDTEDLTLILADLNKIFRLTASIFPVIVEASGVDPAGLIDPWSLGQWDHHFGSIAETIGDAA